MKSRNFGRGRKLSACLPHDNYYVIRHVQEIIIHEERVPKHNLSSFFEEFSLFCVATDTSNYALLVSTYVVCERLSVMHELAGVVEKFGSKF